MLLFSALVFDSQFVAEVSIENRTNETIFVTPIGTYGSQGQKSGLPVKLLACVPLPAFQSGQFGLAPGQSVFIVYDYQDVNFSEIVVKLNSDEMLQPVSDPIPTENKYHSLRDKHYVIDDIANLERAPLRVRAAAECANEDSIVACFVYPLLFGPWVAYGIAQGLIYWSNRPLKSAVLWERCTGPS